MILLEGPNRALRAKLGPLLQAAMPAENPGLHVSGEEFSPTIRRAVKIVHADHRWQIRDGLPTHNFHPEVRHMLAYGLFAAGTVVVICAEDEHLTLAQAEELTPYPRVLPLYCVFPHEDLGREVEEITRIWRAAVHEANEFWGYGSNGPTTRSPIMLVGDRANPFMPIEEARRLAFVSHHGCSMYLHDAMRRAGGRYYVTNAMKSKLRGPNQRALKEEIQKVKPRRIVALGTEAAGMLSSIDAKFELTYHPQYWRRFHAGRLNELVASLQP